MLVSAFSGLDTMKQAYAHAIASGYRFYSYGDACLLFRGRDCRQRPRTVVSAKKRPAGDGGQGFREEALRKERDDCVPRFGRVAKVVVLPFSPSAPRAGALLPQGHLRRKRIGASGFARRRRGSNASSLSVRVRAFKWRTSWTCRVFSRGRRADRRWCVVAAPSAGLGAAPAGPAPAIQQAKPQGAPEAQDAAAQGWSEGQEPIAATGLKGRRLCRRSRPPVLDQRAAQWRRAHCGVRPDRLNAEERIPLCDAGDDAACQGAWRQRQIRITLLRDRDGDGVAEGRGVFMEGPASRSAHDAGGDTFYVGRHRRRGSPFRMLRGVDP